VTPPPAAAPAEQPPPATAPPEPSFESLLRREFEKWRVVPYRDNGTTTTGIGNAPFVRAMFRGVFKVEIPDAYDEQIRTGKLVDRGALEPGDLVFFEGRGIGPFRSKTVGIVVGSNEVALARKEDGVIVAKLSDDRWASIYKTARRMPLGEVTPPTFDLAKYGSDRATLLRDIAQAWAGTLYKAGGTTFEGIGNDEFVREVYGAIYETNLAGDPKTWATMGRAVSRDALEPGDIVLYEASGIGGLLSQRHAGLYIGNGEFVSAVRGSAVAISKLGDARWAKAYRAGRRIDPDVLARIEEERALRRAGARAAGAASTGVGAKAAGATPGALASTAPPRTLSDRERQLREVTEAWRGTPYKLGGTSRSGIDCSAFSRVVYTDVYQTTLPRTAEEQEKLGEKVDRDSLESGDLVFFRTQGMGPLFRSRHVGVYLGGGEFAQASGRRGVTISRLDDHYWSRKYHTGRRIR
jgi:cell wall-associated NlpC family hydrolase